MQLHAQPYNLDASGFYYESYEEYLEKSKGHVDRFGQPVEEYEIQFIDGSDSECEFCKAIGIHQGNQEQVFEFLEEYEDNEHAMIMALVQLSYYKDGFEFDQDPEQLDISIYYCDSMKELAEEFAAEGLFGEIPGHLKNYIDFDAMARDLSYDYTEDRVIGNNIIWRAD